MAIEKRFIHFKKFSDFNSKKLSANEANTQYTVGVSGEIQNGEPDILYQSYCWIKDTKQQWTHGQLYDCSGGNSGEENVQSDWLENTSTDAYIKNRTHYISGTKITSPGIYPVSGSQIYFEGKIYNLEVGVTTTLRVSPDVYAALTTETTLKITDLQSYTATHPIVAVTSITQLDDAFISDNIARTEDFNNVARLDDGHVVANGLVSNEDVYYHLPDINTSDTAHTLATKDDFNSAIETYVADFTCSQLWQAMHNGSDVICDMQSLIEAMRANKIILVRDAEDSSYKGVYVLTGYAEDLLYFSIVNAYGSILCCEGTTYSYDGDYVNFIDWRSLSHRHWDDKQDKLESGANIKTINGESILGEGNIVFNQADWNESDETSSAYVKNRTHYASFNRIEIPETISTTTWTYIGIPNSAGSTIYVKYTFLGKVRSAILTMNNLGVEKEFNGGPRFVVTRTTSSIGIKGTYDEGHILEVSTNVTQLPEFFIPNSIARTSKLSTVATSGSYNDLTDKPTIPDEVTEDTVANWGFTKNAGTLTSITVNGSTVTRHTNGRIDIGNFQEPLVSGTNIVTARGNSILQQGDLFNVTMISDNVEELLSVHTGNCYMYSRVQTTPKTFQLTWSGNIYNDTITIIIITSSTITFTTNSTYPILWANGNIPTFEAGTLYEISFRQSTKGWMGVAVPFTSGK